MVKPRTNTVRAGLAEGRLLAGPVMQVASPELIEMAGAAGFDFVWIDCEHGAFHLETAVHMLRAADAVGLTALVRVPDQTPSLIMRVLDAGAQGVVVPNVSDGAQAQAVVDAARYRQDGGSGRRGACPGTRASWHQTEDWPAFSRQANADVLVWVLIESPAAVRNIDEILQVPHLDGVALGPFDLAHDMGFPGEVDHPEVQASLDEVVNRAQERGVEVIASLFSPDPQGMARERARWAARGIRLFSIGSDRRLIVRAMRERRAAIGTDPEGT
ncbi:HpcH/HpaI aldolase family protein [Verticiella sediminum]|nr:aldolase/citrate lyase family protein [Verticiella sediminum]